MRNHSRERKQNWRRHPRLVAARKSSQRVKSKLSCWANWSSAVPGSVQSCNVQRCNTHAKGLWQNLLSDGAAVNSARVWWSGALCHREREPEWQRVRRLRHLQRQGLRGRKWPARQDSRLQTKPRCQLDRRLIANRINWRPETRNHPNWKSARASRAKEPTKSLKSLFVPPKDAGDVCLGAIHSSSACNCMLHDSLRPGIRVAWQVRGWLSLPFHGRMERHRVHRRHGLHAWNHSRL